VKVTKLVGDGSVKDQILARHPGLEDVDAFVAQFFFEAVLVNSDIPAERDNRLKLLGQVRDVMGQVADFGQIAG
jgi:glycyl-tRNA synthetase beta subunit